ncbi:PRC-barrel domain containing protein [Methylobacterium oryzihabitans]|uniref:PRC-barrel domain containing protein n=2 Tax=Methylobacterium oryzihabitans TaxID=2499852 RepID=A0A437PFQ7_9HYPH|nr:PRC-barrel domain containing protein [Methylobacterium oryzihabitans]
MTTVAPTASDRSDMGSTTTNETSALIASDRVEGTAVRNPNGDGIGRIERLMIEKATGKVAYAVMSFGGFLGMGESYYTVPWSALRFKPELDAYEVAITEDQLRASPPTSAEGRDPSYDRAWEEHVHRYYNATPYWSI